jgi:glycosyltransferase involved in cell wall biosynthesis
MEDTFDVAEVTYWWMGQYASELKGQCPVILQEQSTMLGNISQEINLGTLPFRKRVRNWVSTNTVMSQYQARLHRMFDWILFISSADMQIVSQVSSVSNRYSVIPVPYYLKMAESVNKTPKLNSLVFLGGMHTPYNITSLRFFCLDILPLIIHSVPDVVLSIVGNPPVPSIRKELESPYVRFVGFQHNLPTFLHQHSVFIAPIITGSGICTKILEAMAQGMPIVSTRKGVDGLEVSDGGDILLADDNKSLADKTVELLINPTLRYHIAQGALERFRKTYSYDQVCEQTRQVYEKIMIKLAKRI